MLNSKANKKIGLPKLRSGTLFALLEENCPKGYLAGARLLRRFLEENGYGLNLESLVAFGDYLREERGGKRFAANTVNTYLSAALDRVRYIASHAEGKTTAAAYALEAALKDNLKREKIASLAVGADQILSYEEIRKLVEGCEQPNIALFIEFLSFTGLRISEATGILLSDLKKFKDHYSVRIAGKGSKERRIMAELGLVDRIASHFAGEKYLFEYHGRRYRREHVSMQVKRWGRWILDREISAHTLRHSWATYTIRKTGRHKAVQAQLGHASPATTLALYVHDSFDWQDISGLFKE